MSARGTKDVAGIGMTSQRTRARMVERLREQGIRDARVLAAMETVPRHLFVEEAFSHRAYEDTALPIGHSQYISQPYIVARMIEALIEGREAGRTLEIGTGCGYQAAVLARIATEVYSVERIGALLDRARQNLLGLKLSNLRLTYGDGYQGLEAAAPFDSIILAAAAPEIPSALLRQLRVGGRMLLPMRIAGGAVEQRMIRIDRSAAAYVQEELGMVNFVPLEAGKA